MTDPGVSWTAPSIKVIQLSYLPGSPVTTSLRKSLCPLGEELGSWFSSFDSMPSGKLPEGSISKPVFSVPQFLSFSKFSTSLS